MLCCNLNIQNIYRSDTHQTFCLDSFDVILGLYGNYPLYVQRRQLHVQTVNRLRCDWVHAYLNHLSSFTFIEVFAVANSNDMVSTAEKTRACTDYHQRCWGAVENVLV